MRAWGWGGFALGDLEAALGLRRAPLVGTGQGLPKTPIANGFVGMPKILGMPVQAFYGHALGLNDVCLPAAGKLGTQHLASSCRPVMFLIAVLSHCVV